MIESVSTKVQGISGGTAILIVAKTSESGSLIVPTQRQEIDWALAQFAGFCRYDISITHLTGDWEDVDNAVTTLLNGVISGIGTILLKRGVQRVSRTTTGEAKGVAGEVRITLSPGDGRFSMIKEDRDRPMDRRIRAGFLCTSVGSSFCRGFPRCECSIEVLDPGSTGNFAAMLAIALGKAVKDLA